MAGVPLYNPGQVAPAETTGARLRAADFGPGIGRGVEQLGQAIGEAAQVADHISAMHDEAAVKEQVNGVNQWYADSAYTGPNALFTKKGKDALDTAPMVTKGLDSLIEQKRATLQNDRQRYLFDEAVKPQALDWQRQIAVHTADETRTYAANESAARAGMTAEMAGLSYMDDPAQGEKHLATMRAEIAQSGQLQGWGPEQIAEKQFKATSGVYRDVGARLVKEGPQGPALAREFVDLHKGSISVDDRQAILDHADVEERTNAAEQRRMEADARRAQREAQQDARDRVESGLARLDDTHQPLSSSEFGSLLKDAQATGDENLVKRVREGQFKNGLAVQWNGVPPQQIQDHINELSAKITKAGKNVNPDDVLERDTLQGIYNSSRAQLDSNGLAWVAKNVGISVQPLNMADPISIANRVQAVAIGSRRAGHPIQPLQPEEVAALAPLWRSGNVQQKVMLATQIARFGNLAGDVAQQIAPNDNGFSNLIGIASHSNPAVAASRVNQIITGYEAIKTMPKLVNQQQSIVQFHQYLGNSLQFLPGVADGVYTSAKALLASEANEAGVQDWNSLDGRAWFKAVNSALGAYTKGGQHYGGIAKFNDAPTVLPENMTQADFEARISRSNGPQFRAAQNGIPVFGNGTHPKASDLKKMEWVPSDDGIYRLSDGHSFLHTQSGGFYEIDVRKLPAQ